MPSIINGHSEGGESSPRASAGEDRTLPGVGNANTNVKSLDAARQARDVRTKRARTLFRNGRFVTLEQLGDEEDSIVPDGTG
jgi:hypothetical protein